MGFSSIKKPELNEPGLIQIVSYFFLLCWLCRRGQSQFLDHQISEIVVVLGVQ